MTTLVVWVAFSKQTDKTGCVIPDKDKKSEGPRGVDVALSPLLNFSI